MLIKLKNAFERRIFSKQALKKFMMILILEVGRDIVSNDSITDIINASIFCVLSTIASGDVPIQRQTDIEELNVQS